MLAVNSVVWNALSPVYWNPDLSGAVVQGSARLQEAVARQEWRRGSTLLGGKSDYKHASPPGTGRPFCKYSKTFYFCKDETFMNWRFALVISSNKFKIV